MTTAHTCQSEPLPPPPAAVAEDLVVMAASAGGLSAISKVLSSLPRHFPAAIAVVQHVAPHSRSYMAEILRRRIELPVKEAEAGDRLLAGWVYIAPPDYHLLVKGDRILALSQSPRIQFCRPSADSLFSSAAISYGSRAIAIVLTGTGKDGAAGIQAIKVHGGTVIVQDEASSEFFGMPGAAIATGQVDLVLPLSDVASTLIRLMTERAAHEPGE